MVCLTEKYGVDSLNACRLFRNSHEVIDIQDVRREHGGKRLLAKKAACHNIGRKS